MRPVWPSCLTRMAKPPSHTHPHRNDLYSRYDRMLDKHGVFKVGPAVVTCVLMSTRKTKRKDSVCNRDVCVCGRVCLGLASRLRHSLTARYAGAVPYVTACARLQVETIGDCYFVAGGLIREDEDGMAAVRGRQQQSQPQQPPAQQQQQQPQVVDSAATAGLDTMADVADMGGDSVGGGRGSLGRGSTGSRGSATTALAGEDPLHAYKVFSFARVGCVCLAGPSKRAVRAVCIHTPAACFLALASSTDPQQLHSTLSYATTTPSLPPRHHQAMLEAARQVRMPTNGRPVEIRIGIHTGPVVSGMAGTRMPRFCLFGGWPAIVVALLLRAAALVSVARIEASLAALWDMTAARGRHVGSPPAVHTLHAMRNHHPALSR